MPGLYGFSQTLLSFLRKLQAKIRVTQHFVNCLHDERFYLNIKILFGDSCRIHNCLYVIQPKDQSQYCLLGGIIQKLDLQDGRCIMAITLKNKVIIKSRRGNGPMTLQQPRSDLLSGACAGANSVHRHLAAWKDDVFIDVDTSFQEVFFSSL